MAKKTTDTTVTTTKKEIKPKVAADPVANRNLVRLLNILALLLAITAFLLQFFAVITHHWKWQLTNLSPVLSHESQPRTSVYEDSRIDQNYGLFSRRVNVYANNDQQLQVWGSTRFPRLDNGDEDLYRCLSQTSTLRGSLLTCADRLVSHERCHCRRYPHWNAVIFFEITALVLLGLVVLISALLTTQYHGLLKPIGVALSFLAFLFLLIGLILILSYLKRETRSIADVYPYVHSRLVNQLAGRYPTVLHQMVRRQVQQTYRAYNLLPGQEGHNETHLRQWSPDAGRWQFIPYSSLNTAAYVPRAQVVATQRTTTRTYAYHPHGPAVGYDQVYEHTNACLGRSGVLSILAMILALIIPLLLLLSWLTAKKLGPEVKTVTTTTLVKTEFVPAPAETSVETVPLTRPVHIHTEPVRQVPHDSHGEHTTQTYRT
jgi:hypothetical protein